MNGETVKMHFIKKTVQYMSMLYTSSPCAERCIFFYGHEFKVCFITGSYIRRYHHTCIHLKCKYEATARTHLSSISTNTGNMGKQLAWLCLPMPKNKKLCSVSFRDACKPILLPSDRTRPTVSLCLQSLC